MGCATLFSTWAVRIFAGSVWVWGTQVRKTKVKDFVLHAPNRDELQLINDCIDQALEFLPRLVDGHFAEAMNALHRRTRRQPAAGGDTMDG